MDLMRKDKVVMITGPAKGMGAAVTRAFAAEGCRLALIGRDTGAIAPLADELRDAGRHAIVSACDLTDAAQCEAAVAAARAERVDDTR